MFDEAFAFTVGVEGGYSAEPADKGNWANGELRGTKFGISAAAYPTLDIKNLTVAEAKQIYWRDYWSKIQGEALPPVVAFVVFDSAVNSGVARASEWLQRAAGVPADGVIGPATIAATARASQRDICVEILAQRLVFLGKLPTWQNFGLGWARRVIKLMGVVYAKTA